MWIISLPFCGELSWRFYRTRYQIKVFSLLLYFISQWSHHFKELATMYTKFYRQIIFFSVSSWNLPWLIQEWLTGTVQKQGKNKLSKNTSNMFGHWTVCLRPVKGAEVVAVWKIWPHNNDVLRFLIKHSQVSSRCTGWKHNVVMVEISLLMFGNSSRGAEEVSAPVFK